jgi:uncharacterized protein (TIGR02453 family)
MPRSTKDSSPAANPQFTEASLKFLRGLAKNNDREWFEPRRHIYESALREPMLALIRRVNVQMADFAPDHVKAPEKTVLRIYRDTRFSANKLPYKQHYAAWWGRQGMPKTSGAGFYFHISAKTVMIAAGLYMPDREQLLAVRRYLLDNHQELRGLLTSRKLRAKMTLSDPHALTRAPKGFPKLDPAMDLILYRNWAVETELSPDAILGKNFQTILTSYFRLAAPVVEFLNRPINGPTRSSRPMFALA